MSFYFSRSLLSFAATVLGVYCRIKLLCTQPTIKKDVNLMAHFISTGTTVLLLYMDYLINYFEKYCLTFNHSPQCILAITLYIITEISYTITDH